MHPLFPAQPQQEHAEQDEGEVDGFAAQVLLAEEQGTEHEADHDAAPPHHAHDADQGSVQRQAVEIHIVGYAQEQADEQDAPSPTES